MTNAIIDLTWLVNRARQFVGQNVTGQADFKDEDFIRCLDQETLPTLSIYMPWLVDITVDTVDDRVDPTREGIFQIRTNNRLIGINKLRDGVGAFGSFPYDPLLFGDMVDRQLVADRQSASELALTWRFSAPNVVEIFPKGISFRHLTFETKCVHPTHLRTIPPGAREYLRDLFLADLAIDVLATRQYFSQLQSVFGELQLNLDRLQQQADRRQDIVEKLESKQLKFSNIPRIWIA